MTIQTITTAGGGTFTVPDGVFSLTVEAWGAGGGATGAGSNNASGAGGGGYSLAVVNVVPGQFVYYHVGAHGVGSSGQVNGGAGEDSWVNPVSNIEPSSNGAVGGGAPGGLFAGGLGSGGVGSVGTTNFNGGRGAAIIGGGGGGAGSAGNGSDGTNSGNGGAGGSPDGGAGGNSSASGGGLTAGTAPGGGGAGNTGGAGSNGANGQVRFTWTVVFGPLVTTTLTKGVPGKYFTKKQYESLVNEIQQENERRANLSNLERMELEFSEAQEAADKSDEQLFGRYNYTSYGKNRDAKERLKELQEKRNHHYYMEVVKKAWADHEAKNKK